MSTMLMLAPAPKMTERDEAIVLIRAALKRRSGKSWSVKGGRGTAWGWISISSPPSRKVGGWQLSEADQAELSALLGRTVHHQGVSVPASSEYRREFIARAEGREPEVVGTPYWD
jgi:hypothetical protein